MPETFEEKANNIQHQHVKKALNYIVRNGVSTDKDVYYLKRGKGKPNRYSPNGWATQHKDTGKWIGMKEAARVSFLFAIGIKPNPDFSDKDLKKFDYNGNLVKTFLEKREFSCEYIDIDNRIQRQHIEKALRYIAKRGNLTDKKIYYLERRKGSFGKCAPEGWATQHKDTGKWIGMKEAARVSFLFAIGVKPDPNFRDKDLKEFNRNGDLVKIFLEKRGFPCEYRKS